MFEDMFAPATTENESTDNGQEEFEAAGKTYEEPPVEETAEETLKV